MVTAPATAGSAPNYHGLDGPLVWPKSHSLFLFTVLPWWIISTTPLLIPSWAVTCSFPGIHTNSIYYVQRKQNLSCSAVQQLFHFCRTLLLWGLLQTVAVLPLTAAGPKPSPWSHNSLTVTISFLHSPSAFLPTLVPASLRREETCIRELYKQLVLLNPITQECWAGSTDGIAETSRLGCVHVAPGTSSGGVCHSLPQVYSKIWGKGSEWMRRQALWQSQCPWVSCWALQGSILLTKSPPSPLLLRLDQRHNFPSNQRETRFSQEEKRRVKAQAPQRKGLGGSPAIPKSSSRSPALCSVLTGSGHRAGTRCRRWPSRSRRRGWCLWCRAAPLCPPHWLCWGTCCNPPGEGTNKALVKVLLTAHKWIWWVYLPGQNTAAQKLFCDGSSLGGDQCKILTAHLFSWLGLNVTFGHSQAGHTLILPLV